MKIIYGNNGVGLHTPYQYSDIKTQEQFDIYRQVFEHNEETGEYELVGLDDCAIEWELDDINFIAGEKIKEVYPEYKQLNILRNGTQEEINAMNTFIDAVRAWANSENPDPWDGTLDSIAV